MRFSILIPVYNVEKYLKQCIESVLSQEFEDYEIVLVNDGSTDKSPEICTYYAAKDERIRYFSKENEGLLLTRRYSVKRANGEYVLFLDSDDYWDKNILTILDQAIVESNADIIVYRYRHIRDNGTIVYDDKDIFPDKTLFTVSTKELFIQKYLSSSRLNSLWSKCVHRNIIDVDADYSGFKDKKGEDYLQSIALLRNARTIYYLNDVLYNYRLSETGRGRNFKLKYITDYEAVREHVYNNLLEMQVSSETLRIFFGRYLEGLMLFQNSIVNTCNNYKEYIEICNRIKNFDLYNKVICSKDLFIIRKDANITFRLFDKNHYRILFYKGRIYDFIKKHINIRGTIIETIYIRKIKKQLNIKNS